MSEVTLISGEEADSTIVVPIKLCVFCGIRTELGIALSNDLMSDHDGDKDDWGHLECYIDHVIHKRIETAMKIRKKKDEH